MRAGLATVRTWGTLVKFSHLMLSVSLISPLIGVFTAVADGPAGACCASVTRARRVSVVTAEAATPLIKFRRDQREDGPSLVVSS